MSAPVPEIDDLDGAPLRLVTYSIPNFEGKAVETTKLKVTTPAGLDIDNVVLHTDNIVRLQIEARVTGVAHVVNEKTGKLERVQTVKAIEVTFVPWDPEDPTDVGVAR